MARFLLPMLLAASAALTACGGTDPRYLIDSPAGTVAQQTRLAVATLEVREVSLPAYAEESQILMEGGDGALTPVDGAVWADDPVRAVSLLLADNLSRTTTATVAAEPWPLETPAQAAVQVTVAQLVARDSGRLDLKGQFAISSYDRIVRERIRRFDISVPLSGTSPGAIATATSQAMGQLSDQIRSDLAR